MKDRILQFLSAEKISPAEFADKIGVQRSSMSHILNGRNYPSASFIQKMLQAYPMINARWLMIGEGKMNAVQEKQIAGILPVADSQIKIESTEEKPVVNTQEDIVSLDSMSPEKNMEPRERDKNSLTGNGSLAGEDIKERPNITEHDAGKITSVNESHQPKQAIPYVNMALEEKEIEQVLFFYKDKTFKSYRPS